MEPTQEKPNEPVQEKSNEPVGGLNKPSQSCLHPH